ncbi:glycoside hydrolase family 95 protein [Rhizoctonia solani]|nr:glycoside hydrolase family 95 protein [Rhizoctonia solani]
MTLISWTLRLLVSGTVVIAAPDGFPRTGNGLWYKEPGATWATQYLPIGNGYLGAMVNGNPTSDRLQLNIESLWSGGPFANSSYNGGNHQDSEAGYLATQLAKIRNAIFTTTNGKEIKDVKPLQSSNDGYGSYSSIGYMNINRTASGEVTDYARWLDMDRALLNSVWKEPACSFRRTYFCSNPTRSCTAHTASSAAGGLSATYSFSSLDGLPKRNITCLDDTTLQLRGYVGPPGMLYELLAKIQKSGPGGSTAKCTIDPTTGDAQLVANGTTETWVTWVGGTEYSMDAGNAAHNYSFKGPDPHDGLVSLLKKASSQRVNAALEAHATDYHKALGGFSLDIGQVFDGSKTTAELMDEYQTDTGNPYIEWLLFNFARYMLVESTRSYLPANLQGKWARDAKARWDSDYHANINLQMNYWVAEMTNLKVTSALWDYMEKTWAPRGAETAKVLYNITRGWLVHDELNIFGHSGMKNYSAKSTNYREAPAWMMMHLYDHLDYTNDIAWWKRQGWPLLKGVAQFWLDYLIEDRHFNDSTLVANPCNSPELEPTTFGCANSQQILWQLFESVEKGFDASGDRDTVFWKQIEVRGKKIKLDKGIKIGSFGQLQEWKVEFDTPTNLHRHISHLVGLYPGYVISNFKPPTNKNQGIPDLTRDQVLKAAEVSLISRGNGTGPDGDAGWAKVWRAACWAQLQNSTAFYHQLTYAIERNFVSNLWSLYNASEPDPTFQIDANMGYSAAVLNALIQAPDTSSLSDTLRVILLPALPAAWKDGSIKGARIRSGMSLNLGWSNGKVTSANFTVDPTVRHERHVEVWYDGQLVGEFSAAAGLKKYLVI